MIVGRGSDSQHPPPPLATCQEVPKKCLADIALCHFMVVLCPKLQNSLHWIHLNMTSP